MSSVHMNYSHSIWNILLLLVIVQLLFVKIKDCCETFGRKYLLMM